LAAGLGRTQQFPLLFSARLATSPPRFSKKRLLKAGLKEQFHTLYRSPCCLKGSHSLAVNSGALPRRSTDGLEQIYGLWKCPGSPGIASNSQCTSRPGRDIDARHLQPTFLLVSNAIIKIFYYFDWKCPPPAAFPPFETRVR
jgi:hypothetical protein